MGDVSVYRPGRCVLTAGSTPINREMSTVVLSRAVDCERVHSPIYLHFTLLPCSTVCNVFFSDSTVEIRHLESLDHTVQFWASEEAIKSSSPTRRGARVDAGVIFWYGIGPISDSIPHTFYGNRRLVSASLVSLPYASTVYYGWPRRLGARLSTRTASMPLFIHPRSLLPLCLRSVILQKL